MSLRFDLNRLCLYTGLQGRLGKEEQGITKVPEVVVRPGRGGLGKWSVRSWPCEIRIMTKCFLPRTPSSRVYWAMNIQVQ